MLVDEHVPTSGSFQTSLDNVASAQLGHGPLCWEQLLGNTIIVDVNKGNFSVSFLLRFQINAVETKATQAITITIAT